MIRNLTNPCTFGKHSLQAIGAHAGFASTSILLGKPIRSTRPLRLKSGNFVLTRNAEGCQKRQASTDTAPQVPSQSAPSSPEAPGLYRCGSKDPVLPSERQRDEADAKESETTSQIVSGGVHSRSFDSGQNLCWRRQRFRRRGGQVFGPEESGQGQARSQRQGRAAQPWRRERRRRHGIAFEPNAHLDFLRGSTIRRSSFQLKRPVKQQHGPKQNGDYFYDR